MNKLTSAGVILLIIFAAFVPVSHGISAKDSLNDNGETEYWAVIVEVLDYEKDEYDMLVDHKVNKPRRIYNATLSAKNWNEDHIKFLLKENATRENILDSITWLQKNVDAEDIIFFYYHGHGSKIVDDNGDEKDGTDEIICPHDINRTIDGKAVNIISDDELDARFDQINAKGMFLVFNCCMSGGFKDLDDEKRVILTSCKEQKISIPIISTFLAYGLHPYINESNDGYVYLFNLVEPFNYLGISNITADKDKDGVITAEEISKFSKRRVIAFWSFALLCPVIKSMAKIQLIRVYRQTENHLGLIPQVYDRYEGELPIIEL